MKLKFLISFSIFIILFGCKQNSSKNETSEPEHFTKNIEKVITPAEGDTINIELYNGLGKAKIHKEKGQKIFIKFNSSNYTNLFATLSSEDSLANIRFSQIFMPDGSMDGPFGREIHYNLIKNNYYKLSVSENIMAGDPWSGDFNIEIKLE